MTTTMMVDAGRPRLAHSDRPARRRGRGWLWLLPLILGVPGALVALRGPALDASSKSPPQPRALPIGVSALGRLAPESEVIALAPSSGADGGRVDRLMVAVGDRVQAGQVVAILDPYPRRVAAVRQSQAEVEVARAKLAQAQAGSKIEDIHGAGGARSRSTRTNTRPPRGTWAGRPCSSRSWPARARTSTTRP